MIIIIIIIKTSKKEKNFSYLFRVNSDVKITKKKKTITRKVSAFY